MIEVERIRIIPNPIIEKNLLEIDKTNAPREDSTMSYDMYYLV